MKRMNEKWSNKRTSSFLTCCVLSFIPTDLKYTKIYCECHIA